MKTQGVLELVNYLYEMRGEIGCEYIGGKNPSLYACREGLSGGTDSTPSPDSRKTGGPFIKAMGEVFCESTTHLVLDGRLSSFRLRERRLGAFIFQGRLIICDWHQLSGNHVLYLQVLRALPPTW